MDTGAYSEPALRALGIFGLTTADVRDRSIERITHARALASRLLAALPHAGIALIHGSSGSGKSTLLRALADLLRESGHEPILPPNLARLAASRVIDLLAPAPADIPAALAHLAAAGLADALIPARRVCELSDGQRARLAIALTMHAAAARPSAAILLDELASTLDDATARGLCITLRRWVERTANIRLIAATPRDHCANWLNPDFNLNTDAQSIVHHIVPRDVAARGDSPCGHNTSTPNPNISISPGALTDYHTLAHLHYRAAAPATHVRILVARESQSHTAPIGVLVVSMPTLNGAWRALAWPGEYSGRSRSRRTIAEHLNRDLRCISRLIVDPRFRARGVGAALVRAYLADPLTRCTEAVAAMGAACPVFARAGMREWIPAPSIRDIRLRDKIEAANLRPWMLTDTDLVMQAIEDHPFLDKALRTWARAHGPTRHLAGAPIRDLIRAAAKRVIEQPRAYTADRDER